MGDSELELLQIEPPSQLTFHFELKKQSLCSFHLANKTTHYVSFKVKTTTPEKYSVVPKAGIIAPQGTCDVTVTKGAPQAAPLDFQCKDKFLIQSTIVSPKEIFSGISSRSDKCVEEKKLKVVLLPPKEDLKQQEEPIPSNSNPVDHVQKEESTSPIDHVQNEESPSPIDHVQNEESPSPIDHVHKEERLPSPIDHVQKEESPSPIDHVQKEEMLPSPIDHVQKEERLPSGFQDLSVDLATLLFLATQKLFSLAYCIILSLVIHLSPIIWTRIIRPIMISLKKQKHPNDAAMLSLVKNIEEFKKDAEDLKKGVEELKSKLSGMDVKLTEKH